jgi:hypothetical protein
MLKALQPAPSQTAPAPSPSVEDLYCPSLKNPAVALCVDAWQKIHTATLQQTRNVYTAERCAGKIYRMAMPPLSGYQNICDFIACAGYGMLLGAIKDDNGTKLLYAAQVALSALPQHAKAQPRPEALPAA